MGTVDEKSVLRIPEPPEINHPGHPGVPEKVKQAWKETYARTLRQQLGATGAPPDSADHQAALIEANKAHIGVDHPETYEEAMALPKWKYLVPPHVENELDGNGNATGRQVLRGMTIDGKALRRPRIGRKPGPKGLHVPEKPAKEPNGGPQIVTTDLSGDAGSDGNGKGKGKGKG